MVLTVYCGADLSITVYLLLDIGLCGFTVLTSKTNYNSRARARIHTRTQVIINISVGLIIK